MASVALRPELVALLEGSQAASRALATIKTDVKDAALAAIADVIEANIPAIVEANSLDMAGGTRRRHRRRGRKATGRRRR